MKAGQITVLIADDDPQVRVALAAIVRMSSMLTVVGSAANADEAIGLARRARPDVAVVDFNMPGGGHKAVRGILKRSPRTRVLALSGSDDRRIVAEMLRAGAASYVVKSAPPEQIVEAILRSARGDTILGAEVATSVMSELAAHLERRETEECATRDVLERIRYVIDERLLEPVFQPIVDLTSGLTVGFEALTRFSAEPAQSPDRWFAEADEVGLRVELELAAARMAITRFAEVNQSSYLSLNASPVTLPSCFNLVEVLEPGRIVIEITEHAAIDDYEALAPALNQLRERGALIAVDDAGAGFASLRHTLLLSPDFIKLDVSLTRGIDSDRRRRALAAALIGFANELDATIIAEGIQTAAELKALRQLGVTHGQGHFLANPGPLPRGHAGRRCG